MPTWLQVTLVLLTSLAALALSAVWWGSRRWDASTEALRARLFAQARRRGAVYTRSELCGLPPPVVRYFERALQELQMAQASLQRYFAEARWVPTALLPSERVVWTTIDDSRALATLGAGQVSASRRVPVRSRRSSNVHLRSRPAV